MTVDADGAEIDYDGVFKCKAQFYCFAKEDYVWLSADPVAEDSRIKFRSERCPFCGNNHWRSKKYNLKYE